MASAAPPRLAFLATSMVLLSSLAMATDFIVGGHKGWTLDFNYTDWAKENVFHVGDSLVFNYDNSKHNVLKVNGAQFQECSFTADNELLITGKDRITLKTEGKKWYICGQGNHCADHQMKLVINVAGPASTSVAHSVLAAASLSGVLVAMFAIAAIFA